MKRCCPSHLCGVEWSFALPSVAYKVIVLVEHNSNKQDFLPEHILVTDNAAVPVDPGLKEEEACCKGRVQGNKATRKTGERTEQARNIISIPTQANCGIERYGNSQER